MSRKTTLAAATVLAAALSLAACSSDDDDAEASDATTPAAAQEQPASDAQNGDQAEEPASDIDAAVQTFTTALDDLGIEHTEPERVAVEMSGAQASFDLTVNGYESGILVFPSEDALATWQDASDSFGGVHVAAGNSALSLNSSDGIGDSVEIAPQIADAVGGTAHGV